MKNALLLFTFISSVSFAQTELTLSLGESKNLSLKGNSSVWIQDREILKAEGQGSRLVIKGAREGRTVLKLGSETYHVQVLHPNKTDSLAELKKDLQGIVGLSAQVGEGDLLIKGHLYRLQDWVKLADFARAKAFSYSMRAELSSELQTDAQKYFQELFERAKLPPQTLIFEPSPEIRVSGPDLAFKKYQQILSPFGISVLRDENSLEMAPTVKVQITVAEIKRDLSIQYGLQWPSSYSAKILSTGKRVMDEDLPFNLQALEGQGYGKILASPNILCRSGKEAEFLAGGEFPIKIMNYKAQDVVWKRYGILLRVKPKADAAGRISLSIETEVSTLDDSRKVDGIPGILTNRVSSHFDLTRPQTIALSGLLKSEDGNSSQGLPFLSRLPVIGALFSSKDFRENRSELVIFVRPTILKEGDDGEGLEHLQGRPRL
ncbi:pilus assembly protein [Bdellovibrio sp. HCB-162]|uniref:pilus assembly protein n=1 Tax=Bdellovibrio sp. HCB-162 TaxID=3394234 RepID=UPI0039BD8446